MEDNENRTKGGQIRSSNKRHFAPADEDLNDALSLDEMLIRNRVASFMLKVSTNIMIDAGIQPGDLLVVDRSLPAINGDIVVAIFEGRKVLGGYSQCGNVVTLSPANANYWPVKARADDENFSVIGVVRSLARVFR